MFTFASSPCCFIRGVNPADPDVEIVKSLAHLFYMIKQVIIHFNILIQRYKRLILLIAQILIQAISSAETPITLNI